MIDALKQAGRNRREAERRPKRRRRRDWVRWPDQRLLDLRICDLDLSLERSPLRRLVRQVLAEVERAGLRFRPHFWLSSDWFTPDGIPGVAVPFYLAHPRLIRLERREVFEVEGGAKDSCMRILRHEVGHAINNAYRLSRRRGWRELFGKSSEPYPTHYKPRPYSKQYVLNLDYWYAQSHPDEDFAETFAVWLKPRSGWRKRYADWPALQKLEYVDELMGQIGSRPPVVRSRATMDPMAKIRKTLREYYAEKRSLYAAAYPRVYDQDLRRLFSDSPRHEGWPLASAFLRQIRTDVRRMVSQWTGEYQYTLDLVLKEIIGRCKELRLRAVGAERKLKIDFAIMLTVHTMNYLHSGGRRTLM